MEVFGNLAIARALDLFHGLAKGRWDRCSLRKCLLECQNQVLCRLIDLLLLRCRRRGGLLKLLEVQDGPRRHSVGHWHIGKGRGGIFSIVALCAGFFASTFSFAARIFPPSFSFRVVGLGSSPCTAAPGTRALAV